MFEKLLTVKERRAWKALTTPSKIQEFLDGIPYSTDSGYRSPLQVLRDRKAHCFDGALFGAAALRKLGYPPAIVYLTAVRDDDHCIAVFRKNRAWGALAKSNFTGIRFRDPVYRSLRELVLSYFEGYFNVKGERTLRGYTQVLDLSRYDSLHWMESDRHLETVADRLDYIRSYSLLKPSMIRSLSRVDRVSYNAGLLGSNPKGLYRP